MDAKLITDANGSQVKMKTIIKSTIKILEPEINALNIGESIDRILSRMEVKNNYYTDQLNIYKKSNSFVDVIKNNIQQLKR